MRACVRALTAETQRNANTESCRFAMDFARTDGLHVARGGLQRRVVHLVPLRLCVTDHRYPMPLNITNKDTSVTVPAPVPVTRVLTATRTRERVANHPCQRSQWLPTQTDSTNHTHTGLAHCAAIGGSIPPSAGRSKAPTLYIPSQPRAAPVAHLSAERKARQALTLSCRLWPATAYTGK